MPASFSPSRSRLLINLLDWTALGLFYEPNYVSRSPCISENGVKRFGFLKKLAVSIRIEVAERKVAEFVQQAFVDAKIT